jgi:hypothetical protein
VSAQFCSGRTGGSARWHVRPRNRPVFALGVCFAVAIALLMASFAEARGIKSNLFLSGEPQGCNVRCSASRGVFLYPHFLTSTHHYPCVDYKMQLTAYGWQLKRVFMCW